MIKDCAISGKRKRSRSRGFGIAGGENRAEERRGKCMCKWGLRHRECIHQTYTLTPEMQRKYGIETTTPLSEGLCINTQCNGHSVHWRENEPLSSDPSTLQWIQCQDGEVCRARNTQLQIRFEFWRQNSLKLELKLNYWRKRNAFLFPVSGLILKLLKALELNGLQELTTLSRERWHGNKVTGSCKLSLPHIKAIFLISSCHIEFSKSNSAQLTFSNKT